MFGDRSKRRLHAQVLLDQHRPTPDRDGQRRPRTTPPWPNTGPTTAQNSPCRSTAPPGGSTKPRTAAARSAGRRSLPVEDRPQTPREWETWLAASRKTIDVTWKDGTADEAEPRLIHAHCRHRQRHGTGPTLLPAHDAIGLA